MTVVNSQKLLSIFTEYYSNTKSKYSCEKASYIGSTVTITASQNTSGYLNNITLLEFPTENSTNVVPYLRQTCSGN